MKEIFGDNKEIKEENKILLYSDINIKEEEFESSMKIINVNVDEGFEFIEKMLRVRDTDNTKKLYGDNFITFIRKYYEIFSDMLNALNKVVNHEFPSFYSNESEENSSVYSDIKNNYMRQINKILIIVYNQTQRVEDVISKMIDLAEGKKYVSELQALKQTYDNFVENVRLQLEFEGNKNLYLVNTLTTQ